MKVYKNGSGKSGVARYEIADDFIDIKFKDSSAIYRYTYLRCGKDNIEAMKKLAVQGKGLSTYVSHHPQVKNNFEILY